MLPPGELGNRVRAARAYAGEMSREELAAQLPFSGSTLYRIEIGARALTELEEPAFAAAVAKATGMPAWFFTEDMPQAHPQRTAKTNNSGHLEQELAQFRKELRAAQGETARAVEKLARSTAYDRGRMTRIEKNLTDLGQVLLKDLEKRDP